MTRSPAVWTLVAALTAQVALACGLMVWSGWIAGALLSLPLLPTLPGLLRRRPRSAAYCAFVLVVYVALLLSEALAMPERHTMGLLLACIGVVSFVALILFVRWSARDVALREYPETGARKESSGGVSH